MAQLLERTMMQRPKLSKFAEARVWTGELPDYAVMNGEASPLFTASASEEVPARSVAVEWLIPLGPRSLYGLLGAKLCLHENACLIEIIEEKPTRGVAETIASRVSESSLVGMLPEYAAAVKRGAELALAGRSTLPACRITFCAAVVGEVGSCEAIFENLARVVLQLLLTPSLPSDAELPGWLIYQAPTPRPASVS
jgi:hypothetical protein